MPADGWRTRVVETTLPIDLRRSFGSLDRGRGDPTTHWLSDLEVFRATRTPEGLAVAHFRAQTMHRVKVRSFGPGAEWMLERAPEHLGSKDTLEGFNPQGLVQELARRFPALRMIRTNLLIEPLVLAILEQKVPGKDALMSHRALIRTFGEVIEAPDAPKLAVLPPPKTLATLASFQLREAGVDGKRSAALQEATKRAARLERLVIEGSAVEARRILQLLPGIGPWTAAESTRVAMGDPDAISVGDYHVPNLVAWNLAGEPRANDERMLELLEPYVGHRARVVQLLMASGTGAPKYGPRIALRPFVAGHARK